MGIISILVRQYLIVLTGATIRLAYMKIFEKGATWKSVTEIDESSAYPKNNAYNFYCGIIFWIVVVLSIVLV